MSSDQNQKNIEAWDHLYERTTENIWGVSPLPFLSDSLNQIKNQLNNDDSVLDAGTGEGRNLPVLIQSGLKTYACDASEHGLSRIHQEIRSKVTLSRCDLSKTPFRNEQFKLITMLDVFETLPDSSSVLGEMHRILNPNGYLLVNIPDSSDSISTINMDPLPQGGYLYEGKYYYRFYNEKEVMRLSAEHGFRVYSKNEASWIEEPHTNYRTQRHKHTSIVYILQKI